MNLSKATNLLPSVVLGLLLISPCAQADNGNRVWSAKRPAKLHAVNPIKKSRITLSAAMTTTADTRLRAPMKAGETTTVMLSEDFSKFTVGSEDAPDMTNITTSDGEIMQDYINTYGWSGVNIYQAGGCCFLADGTEALLMTPSIDLSADNGNFEIQFSYRAQSGSANVYIFSQTYGGPQPHGMKASCDENWKTGVATFNGYGGSQTVIQFYGDAPIFIDDITITQKESSETVSTISAPVIMDATDVTDNSFTANWQTVTTATAYLFDVFYFSDNQPQYVLKDYQTTNTSEPVSGLQAGRLYYYSVQATDGTLTSDESAIMAAMKPVQDLDTPVATAATEVSKDEFRANWNSVDSAAYYSLTTVSEYKVPQSGTFVLDDETFDKVTSGTINAPEYNSIECSLDQYTEHPDWLGITTLLANGMIGLKNYYAMMGSYSMLYSPLYQVSTANPGEIKATISAQMVNCTNGTRLGVALVDAETGDILGNGWQFVTLSNEMTSYDFDLGTSNYYYIAIGFSDPNDTYGTTGMVFIDGVKITQEMEAGTTLSRIYRYDTAYNNSFYVETPDSPDGENFYYYVTAVSNGTDDYVYSEPSNVVIVDTNTGIGNAVTADGTTITASAGQINISATEACTVSVFDMSGRTVRQFDAVEGSTSFPIEPGAYIVKCGETVRKVLVR